MISIEILLDILVLATNSYNFSKKKNWNIMPRNIQRSNVHNTSRLNSVTVNNICGNNVHLHENEIQLRMICSHLKNVSCLNTKPFGVGFFTNKYNRLKWRNVILFHHIESGRNRKWQMDHIDDYSLTKQSTVKHWLEKCQ